MCVFLHLCAPKLFVCVHTPCTSVHPRSDACAVTPRWVTPRSQRDRLQITATALLQSKKKKELEQKQTPLNTAASRHFLRNQLFYFFIREFMSIAMAAVVFLSPPFRQTGNERATCFSDCAVQSFPFKDVKWKRHPSSGDLESGLCAICRDQERNGDGKTRFWRFVAPRRRRRKSSRTCAVTSSAHRYVHPDRLQSETHSARQSCDCQRNKSHI